jgi:glycyl-tRNA synthetase
MAQQDDNLLKKIISHAKEYGFIFPSSEIYDGLSAVYDTVRMALNSRTTSKNIGGVL